MLRLSMFFVSFLQKNSSSHAKEKGIVNRISYFMFEVEIVTGSKMGILNERIG